VLYLLVLPVRAGRIKSNPIVHCHTRTIVIGCTLVADWKVILAKMNEKSKTFATINKQINNKKTKTNNVGSNSGSGKIQDSMKK
jgi:hypothetical protein